MSILHRFIQGALVVGLVSPAPVMAREIIGSEEPPEEEAPPPKKKAPPPKEEPRAPARQADKPAAGKEPGPTIKRAQPNDLEDPLEEKPAAKGKDAKAAPDKDALNEADIRKAEQEARKRREEEVTRKKALEAERKATATKASLENAKVERVFKREAAGVLYSIKLLPGAVEPKKLTELVFDARVKLEDPDPTYGDYAPVEDLYLVATLTPVGGPPAPATPEAKPADSKAKGKGKAAAPAPAPAVGPSPVAYVVHSLGDAGMYGFHVTFPSAGKWEVRLSGSRKDGKALEGSFPLHVGIWPPPDFDQEEKNNQTLGGNGRRAIE